MNNMYLFSLQGKSTRKIEINKFFCSFKIELIPKSILDAWKTYGTYPAQAANKPLSGQVLPHIYWNKV